VLAEAPSSLRVLHRLEQRSEYRWRDLRPVERTACKQGVPHRLVEGRNSEDLLVDVAVYVREPLHQLVKVAHSRIGRARHRLEEHRQLCTKVRAIFACTRLDELKEQVSLPDRRVVRIQCEQSPDHEDRRFMVREPGTLQLLPNTSHQLRSLD